MNTAHYSFSASLAGGDDGELRVFGYTKGDLLVRLYSGKFSRYSCLFFNADSSGITGCAYATSNRRYGEGAFAACVSRWRYTGLEQTIEVPGGAWLIKREG